MQFGATARRMFPYACHSWTCFRVSRSRGVRVEVMPEAIPWGFPFLLSTDFRILAILMMQDLDGSVDHAR